MRENSNTADGDRNADLASSQGKPGYKLALAITTLFSPIFLAALWFRVADNDLFARVSVGRLIWTTLAVPHKDLFAYSQTKPTFIDHEWLSAIIFYACSRLQGDFSLLILNLSTALLTIFFLVRTQRNLGENSLLKTTVLLLCLLQSSFIWNSTVRAQVFTFFFWAIFIFLNERYEKSGSRLILVFFPALTALWANLHAGFVVGLGFLWLHAIVRLFSARSHRIELTLTAAVSSAVVLINPYGSDYFIFLLEAITKSRPQITEWSASIPNSSNVVFYLFAAAGLAALHPSSRNRIPLHIWTFGLTSLVFGIMHQRHVPFFMMLSAIYLPSALEPRFSKSPWLYRRAENLEKVTKCVLLCLTSGMLILGVKLLTSATSLSLDYSQYPVQAMDWLLERGLKGRLLAHFNYGSYVLMRGYPDFQVAIDGRYEEVYPDSTFDQALAALNPNDPSFAASFAALKPDFVLLCEDTTPLVVSEHFPGHWQRVFLDDSGRCAVFAPEGTTVPASPTRKIPASLWNLRF